MIRDAARKGKRMKRNFNLFVICGHCIVFAVLLGSGINIGFIVDTWFRPVFGYGDESWVGAWVAVLSGLTVGLGAYGLFIHSERALKTILRLPKIEAWIRGLSLVALNVGFVALGIAGLTYRLSFLNSRGVGFLLVIGVILEISTPIFGIVMQPLQNPAADALEEERLEAFERRTIAEAYDALEARPVGDRFKALRSGLNEDIIGEAVELLPKEAPKIPRRKRGVLTNKSNQGPVTQPLQPNAPTLPLPAPAPTTEEAERAVLQALIQKYGTAPFLTGLQEKNRAR